MREGRGARLYLARYRFFFQSRISAERAVPAWRCLRSAARGGGDFPRNWYTRLATVNLNGRRDNFHEIKLLRAIDLYIGSFGHLALFYAFLYCARFFRTSWNFQSIFFGDSIIRFSIYYLLVKNFDWNFVVWKNILISGVERLGWMNVIWELEMDVRFKDVKGKNYWKGKSCPVNYLIDAGQIWMIWAVTIFNKVKR